MNVEAIPVYVTKKARGFQELVDAYAVGIDGKILVDESGYITTYTSLDEIQQVIKDMHPRQDDKDK